MSSGQPFGGLPHRGTETATCGLRPTSRRTTERPTDMPAPKPLTAEVIAELRAAAAALVATAPPLTGDQVELVRTLLRPAMRRKLAKAA